MIKNNKLPSVMVNLDGQLDCIGKCLD
jgi:hypothetical protein